MALPSPTATVTPLGEVQASSLTGFASGATVRIDVDLNNDGNFTDPGETGYATGTLADPEKGVRTRSNGLT